MSESFLSCIKVVKEPSEVQEGRWNFSRAAEVKQASSRLEGRFSWFFSSCGRNLGVLIKLGWGPQGPARVASGKLSHHVSCEGTLGVPFQWVQGPRSSFRVEVRFSGFLSSADMNLGVPMEFQEESQASSRLGTCKSAFLSSFKSRVRLLVELT